MNIFPKCRGTVSRWASLFVLLVLLLCGLPAAPFGVPAPWGEILSNFALYYIAALLCLLPIIIVLARTFPPVFTIAILGNSLGLIVYYAVPVAPFFISADRRAAALQGQVIGVLSVDLENSTKYTEEILPLIKQKRPAIVGVSGVTPEISQQLSAAGLPILSVVPRSDGFGLALLSSLPVQAAITTEVGASYEDLPPAIQTYLTLPDGSPLHVSVFRSPPPSSKDETYTAEILIRRVFVPLRHEKNPYLAIGNLNGTPTSGYYGRLWWATGAHNAMEGSGYHASCCADSWWKKLPVNHILFNGELGVRSFAVLPNATGRVSPVWAEIVSKSSYR